MLARPHTRLLFAIIALTALALAACSGGSGSDAPAPTPTASSPPTPLPPIADDAPLPDDTQVAIVNSETVVGENRLYVIIHDNERRPIANAKAHLLFFLLNEDGSAGPLKAEGDVEFIGEGIPSAQGAYSMRASFDEPGRYRVEASVTRGQDGPVVARSSFNVQARSSAPSIGDDSPRSANLTLKDAPIEHLTSQRPTGDPDFYRLTIAKALDQRKPLMVVFSTPAFCQTRTCGPQLEAAQALKLVHGDRVNFIHVDVFERPDLLLTGETQPKVNPVLLEWRLQTEPWVYVIGAQGKVHDRFEGFASRAELERSLLQVLTPLA